MSPPSIVVVEDQEEIRELELFLLEEQGYTVVGVADGALACEVIRQVNPALVLLDLVLPNRGGNAILEELRALPQTREIPVIVVSAYPDELRRTAQVRRIIHKPFEMQPLLDAVRLELPARG